MSDLVHSTDADPLLPFLLDEIETDDATEMIGGPSGATYYLLGDQVIGIDDPGSYA